MIENKKELEENYFNFKIVDEEKKERPKYNYSLQKEKIEGYVDGSCLLHTESKCGGWGVVILVDGKVVQKLSGNQVNTTNQQMELTAAIELLKSLKPGTEITVLSDSNYVIVGITEWIHNWKVNGKNYANKTLWDNLYELTYDNGLKVNWKHVKAHNGITWNEEADRLATKESSVLAEKEAFKNDRERCNRL